MTIRLLHSVGNDQAGAVLSVTEDRARRLIMTGYAEAVSAESDEKPKRKKKE